MIDTLSIVFSIVMVLYIIIRAIQLDKSEPWFNARAPVPKIDRRRIVVGESPADAAARGRR